MISLSWPIKKRKRKEKKRKWQQYSHPSKIMYLCTLHKKNKKQSILIPAQHILMFWHFLVQSGRSRYPLIKIEHKINLFRIRKWLVTLANWMWTLGSWMTLVWPSLKPWPPPGEFCLSKLHYTISPVQLIWTWWLVGFILQLHWNCWLLAPQSVLSVSRWAGNRCNKNMSISDDFYVRMTPKTTPERHDMCSDNKLRHSPFPRTQFGQTCWSPNDGGPTLQLTGLKGSATNTLVLGMYVPQRSCVYFLQGKSQAWSTMGPQ